MSKKYTRLDYQKAIEVIARCIHQDLCDQAKAMWDEFDTEDKEDFESFENFRDSWIEESVCNDEAKELVEMFEDVITTIETIS